MAASKNSTTNTNGMKKLTILVALITASAAQQCQQKDSEHST
jgi:hypothetical protein